MTLLDDVAARLRAAGCVFAEEEAALLLDADGVRGGQAGMLEEFVARRVAGEPLEHVLGRVEFAGRRWSVGPGVFVPRRRTELMVRTALAEVSGSRGRIPRRGPDNSADAVVVVDLCCGCGAVGGAVLLGLRSHVPDGGTPAGRSPRVTLHASDVDPAATAHARANLEPLGATVRTGDLLEPLPTELRGRVDVLLCNAPYVPADAIATMPPEARDHEPPTALDGGPDGLHVLRRVVAAAPDWLRAGTGRLLFEISPGQAATAVALAERAGLRPAVVHDEDADGPGGTVVVATLP
ncbi:putative protein N(5)-glutamine methyltransferase [Isoptericola variabilis]|uniref:Modification methylase, HemK family n=1 Tax=Isoptericola variabilis (strain 225) TaxID=743718 RepID=F6FS65_ISOV2|nr:putative protein N(5)-glutamine methyltransferase [Isoptericola variabilis]AEG45162.1 putative protein-(glutamine-N5) methyltransferase, unknown substrate-specific [Isoptericola variabilis 225]TWH31454.1 release factor glutamine methyltransferase [Isoptericola variabilis J7]